MAEKKHPNVNHRNYSNGPSAEINGKLMKVPRDKVKPNAYNYNAQSPGTFTKLVESVRQFGFVDPITVRELQNGDYEIINGEHRWRAAVELEMPEVTIVNLGVMDDARAKQLSVVLLLSGEPDEVRLADLLRDIAKDTDVGELSKTMPFSDKELLMYIEAVNFSFATSSDQDTRPAGSESDSPPEEMNADVGPSDEDTKQVSKASKFTMAIPKGQEDSFQARLRRIDKDPFVAVQKALSAWEAAQATDKKTKASKKGQAS